MRHLRFALLAALLVTLQVTNVHAQSREVSGVVTDATSGDPLAGVNVVVKGTQTGTVTGAEGTYSITLPDDQNVLVFTFVGYKQKEVELDEGQTTADVQLQQDVMNLEGVVISGRATTVRQRNLANAVSTVEAADLERAPAQTVSEALQGKVPGANIQRNSGAPGGGIQVNLRGVSSINAGAQPLYVVDGVIVSNESVPTGMHQLTEAASTFGETATGPGATEDNSVNRTADLNPQDIERIEVLKGASASAIYGSKASNGVVVITTKRGRAGETRVRFSQQVGTYDLKNTLGARTFDSMEEAVNAFGEQAREYFEQGVTYNNEAQLAGRNLPSYETSMSVSGGNEDTKYYVSGLFKDDQGIIENTGYDKQSLRVNLDQQFGSRITAKVSTNLVHSLARRGLSNNDNSGISYWMVFPRTPNFIDLSQNEDGTFPENPFYNSNPLQTAHRLKNDEDVWRFISSARVNALAYRSDTQSLEFNAIAGVDYFNQTNEFFSPPGLQYEDDDGLPGTSIQGNSNNLQANASLSAIHTYRGDGFEASTSGGLQYEVKDFGLTSVTARDLAGGQQRIDAGSVIDTYEYQERIEDLGVYLQEELLLFDEKLLITAAARADRSSNYGNPGTWFFFPKASASYRFVDPLSFTDEIKVRAAYGESGNQPLYGQKFTPLTANENIEGLSGLQVGGTAGDPNIQPERQREVEGGVDLVFFDERAKARFTVYQQNISNLLLQRQLAPSSGFQEQFLNGGSMRVRGIEASLSGTPLRSQNFSWFLQGTFSTNDARITDLPVPAFQTGGFGASLGTFQIEEGRSPTRIVGIVDGEVQTLGNVNPDFNTSFSTELSVGGLRVSGLVDWKQGGDVINLTKLLYDFAANTWDWDERGQERAQQFGTKTGRWVEDGSYVKLREISLSYNIPERLTNSVWDQLESARLRVSGRNLVTWTDYSGMDPEVSNFGSQQISRNIDVAPYPPSRSFWVGIDVTL
jgi:TonB-linked SusC/RagA family outer membrane protein